MIGAAVSSRVFSYPGICNAPFCKIDLRMGGKFLFCMRPPDGKDYWSTGVYREIVEPEWIVYTDNFADDKGNVVPGSYYGMDPDFPLDRLVMATFKEHGGKTKLTLKYAGAPSGKDRDNARAGWNQSFDKLADHLHLKGAIVVEHLRKTERRLLIGNLGEI